MAAIGGWNFGSTMFSLLAADTTHRKEFANNTLKFLRRHGFDGLDVDWEYPGQRDGRTDDKKNFPLLLKDLYEVLHPEKLELSIAVGATSNHISLSYNVSEIAKYVDFVNLMSYDLQGSWNAYTGLHTALYPGKFSESC